MKGGHKDEKRHKKGASGRKNTGFTKILSLIEKNYKKSFEKPEKAENI